MPDKNGRGWFVGLVAGCSGSERKTNGPARPNSLHPIFLQSGEQDSPSSFFALFGFFSIDTSFEKVGARCIQGRKARAREGQMVKKEAETIQRVLDVIRRGSSRREGRSSGSCATALISQPTDWSRFRRGGPDESWDLLFLGGRRCNGNYDGCKCNGYSGTEKVRKYVGTWVRRYVGTRVREYEGTRVGLTADRLTSNGWDLDLPSNAS